MAIGRAHVALDKHDKGSGMLYSHDAAAYGAQYISNVMGRMGSGDYSFCIHGSIASVREILIMRVLVSSCGEWTEWITRRASRTLWCLN